MASFNQYSLSGLENLRLYSEGSSSSGSIELWFPFIELNGKVRLEDAIRNLTDVERCEADQKVLDTFFHEYIHIVQSVKYAVCQWPFLLTLQFIYDAYSTAKARRDNGENTLLPIKHFRDFYKWVDLICKVYGSRESVTLHGKGICQIGLLDILEGAASIIEEKWSGVCSGTKKYKLVRDVNSALLGDKKLGERSLLSVIDASLETEFPHRSFVTILKSLQGDVVDKSEDLYLKGKEILYAHDVPLLTSQSDDVICSSKSVLTSNIFNHYLMHIKRLYGEFAGAFNNQPPMTYIYDALDEDKNFTTHRGLPLLLVNWIYSFGSPAVQYQSGEMVQFDKDIGTKSNIDQGIAGIKAVVRCLSDSKNNQCALRGACEWAANQRAEGCPQISEDCINSPWNSYATKGVLCPFTSIWTAFGLKGFSKGKCIENIEYNPFSCDAMLKQLVGECGYGKTKLRIEIWPNDPGAIPHFHVSGGKLLSCIQIEEARYFKHNKYSDELNHKQRKELQSFLNSPFENGCRRNWDEVVRLWNLNNSAFKVPENVEMPNYAQIAE